MIIDDNDKRDLVINVVNEEKRERGRRDAPLMMIVRVYQEKKRQLYKKRIMIIRRQYERHAI